MSHSFDHRAVLLWAIVWLSLTCSVFSASDHSSSPRNGVTTNAAGKPPLEQEENRDDAVGHRSRIPTEKAIEIFEQRVSKNFEDYLSLTVLGQLYLRHARESDDLSAYAKAENALQEALRLRPTHLPAKIYLAQALQARHHFADALKLAEEVAKVKPHDPLALATVGDSQLQLGRYEDAEKTYAKLAARTKSPAVLGRLAHLAELRGNNRTAVEHVEKALREVDGHRSRSYVSWYELRLASLHFCEGRLEEAEQHYRAALKLDPSCAPAMSRLATLHALRGQYDAAIELFERAIELHGAPPMMAALGDVYAKIGDTETANDWYETADATMAEEAKQAAAAHYREVSLFYSDHDRNLPRALELARKDMRLRQDIYAYDTLAWALHKNGQHDESLPSITQALRLGTRDARLYFHAGMIYDALGDHERARESLRRALAINPHFSLLQAPLAQQTLERLADSPGDGSDPSEE